MTDYTTIRLGKRPRRHDPRTLKLAHYLAAPEQVPSLQSPTKVDYACGIKDWGVMLNDRLGDCTIAAVGHAIQTWRLNACRVGTSSQPLTPLTPPAIPDATILEYYEKWDGYNPSDVLTDQGGVELDVLNQWRQQGFAGHPLDAYVAVGPGAPQDMVRTAIWLFGGLYIGLELPIEAQTGGIWDVSGEGSSPESQPGSWGGHAVYVVGYDIQYPEGGIDNPDCRPDDSDVRIAGSEPGDSNPHRLLLKGGLGTANPASRFRNPGFSPGATPGAVAPPLLKQEGSLGDPGLSSPIPGPQSPVPGFLTCITWGRPKQMTWAFFEKYCSEAYALVSRDWLSVSGISPSGFDLAALEKDLEAVSHARSALITNASLPGFPPNIDQRRSEGLAES